MPVRSSELRAIAPSDQRRMEAGIFNYGNDMDVTNNPFEITGLERLAELDNDNEFVSRKALEQIKADGVQQKLVGVKIDGEPLGMWLEDFWPVVEGDQGTGKQVGRLVSASYSPRLDFNMGFAWVPIAAATEGTRIEIDVARRPDDGDGDRAAVPRPEEGDPREGVSATAPALASRP